MLIETILEYQEQIIQQDLIMIIEKPFFWSLIGKYNVHWLTFKSSKRGRNWHQRALTYRRVMKKERN